MKRFLDPCKKCFISSPIGVGSHNATLFGGQVSSLAHCLMTSSKIICNCKGPLLVDIVRFDPLRITISLTVLKRVY